MEPKFDYTESSDADVKKKQSAYVSDLTKLHEKHNLSNNYSTYVFNTQFHKFVPHHPIIHRPLSISNKQLMGMIKERPDDVTLFTIAYLLDKQGKGIAFDPDVVDEWQTRDYLTKDNNGNITLADLSDIRGGHTTDVEDLPERTPRRMHHSGGAKTPAAKPSAAKTPATKTSASKPASADPSAAGTSKMVKRPADEKATGSGSRKAHKATAAQAATALTQLQLAPRPASKPGSAAVELYGSGPLQGLPKTEDVKELWKLYSQIKTEMELQSLGPLLKDMEQFMGILKRCLTFKPS